MASKNSKAPRSRRDAERNRALLIEIARKAFGEEGGELSYAELARRAGVGRTTVHRCFPKRGDIVIAVFDEQIVELEELAASLGDEPGGFFVLLQGCVERSLESAGLVDAFLDPATGPSPTRFNVRLEALVEPVLRRSQDAGLVRPDLRPSDIRMMMRMLNGAMGPRAVRTKAEWPRAYALLLDAVTIGGESTPLPAVGADWTGRGSGAT